jgi:hypothetical protein
VYNTKEKEKINDEIKQNTIYIKNSREASDSACSGNCSFSAVSVSDGIILFLKEIH